jgi:hypothetical protein
MAGVPQRAKQPTRTPRTLLEALLEFRPWMLALAVFLACAIGIAIMERSRDDGTMWAQAAEAPAGPRR